VTREPTCPFEVVYERYFRREDGAMGEYGPNPVVFAGCPDTYSNYRLVSLRKCSKLFVYYLSDCRFDNCVQPVLVASIITVKIIAEIGLNSMCRTCFASSSELRLNRNRICSSIRCRPLSTMLRKNRRSEQLLQAEDTKRVARKASWSSSNSYL
jgi:hypothetical protein